MEPKDSAHESRKSIWPWVVLGLTLLVIAVLRVRMLDVPLERDEGEYAYAGQLILQGVPPYKLVYNMKLPGVYAAYALIMAIFGQSTRGIHLGFMFLNLGTMVLLFMLVRKLFGDVAAAVSSASYGLLTFTVYVLGHAAHAEHFIVPFVIAGSMLLLKAAESRRAFMFFLSGVLFGLAFVMKQHAAVFVLFGLLYSFWVLMGARRFRTAVGGTASYLVGAGVPFGITCLILYRAGVFDTFWFWTFHYAGQYVSETSMAAGMNNLITAIRGMSFSLGLWALALVGLVMVLTRREARPQRVFVVGLLAASFLAVTPGLYFREHYFVQMMPSLAMLAGAAVSMSFLVRAGRIGTPIVAGGAVVLLLASLAAIAADQSEYLGTSDPIVMSRRVYYRNPFPESVEVAKYIKARTTSSDTIAVMGSEPQIYFYTGRRSATGFIYMYPLMERQAFSLRMQRDMIRELETAKPKYIVLSFEGFLWQQMPSGIPMADWMKTYVPRHYERVGLADIVAFDFPPFTNYYWGKDAEGRTSETGAMLMVYRSKD